ncbi:MAG: site-specific DNA-methyltransferase, partial [Bacteroidales bacterium]|nr:site-specific DNA-methyltransferase [Bacteroidales bacterium]
MPTLHWIGKEKVINHHMDVPFKVLEHSYGFDNGKQTETETKSGNKIIHGDNLEALKTLLPEYEGKIKCIYIDPPYNTGNESWVYNDNVNDPKIKKWLGQVVGKEAEDLTRHDKWLCMMYPRLKLLHKLLADDGAIFISIDKNEEANLKLICDEIFGTSNFIANVAVVNNLKGRSDDKFIATAHESLMIFQKGKFTTNGVPVPEEYQEEYKEKDEKGNYRLLGLRKRGSNSREIDRPNLFYPIYYNTETNSISLENQDGLIEILPKLSNGENGNWRWGKDTLISRIDEVEVRIVKTRNEFDVFQKDY